MTEAFLSQAMRLHGDAVYRLALCRLQNTADAEDVYQETFLRLFQEREAPSWDASRLKAWFLRVAVNKCTDIGRKRKHRAAVGLEDLPELAAEDRYGYIELWDAVNRLPEKHRLVFHLFYGEGYKTEEMNPWYIFSNKYQIGDTANVKIVSLMPFGAFAEMVPGVDGLIHISQIADHKIAKPEDVLSIGQMVDVKITDIDAENHKISLSMRALLEQPTEEDVGEEAPADHGPVIYSTDNPDSYKEFAGDEE